MKMTAELRGMAELNAALSGLANADGLAEVLEACAGDVRDAAAANLADGAPPDNRTGVLAQSLAITPGAGGLSVTVSTPLDYGWHLEYGTLARPATPWLAPALDAAAPSIRGRLRDWLNSAVR